MFKRGGLRWLAITLCCTGLWACGARAAGEQNATMTARGPSLAQARQATYHGLSGLSGGVTLRGGLWEGPPHVAGGASRPRVVLAEPFLVRGDLDSDGREESVVLLSFSSGGSGEFVYFAVLSARGAEVHNVATLPLGDRVKVVGSGIEGGVLRASLLQAGPSDPACCPGELVTRAWRLDSQKGLQSIPVDGPPRRLTVDVLRGRPWRLRAWSFNEHLAGEVVPTLEAQGDRIAGFAGCNRYFATVQDGERAGDLTIGPVGATRMACPEPDMRIEDRFLMLLARVTGFSFLGGQLALVYAEEGAAATMLFERAGE